MQRLIVTHFIINPVNKMAILNKPTVIEARENGMITGIFHVSPHGNIYNAGQTQPFAFVKRVYKDPANNNYFLAEIGRFEK